MESDKNSLADRWIYRLRNNPLIATAIILGALISIATPISTVAKKVVDFLKPHQAASILADQPEALRADRDTVLIPARNALRENKAIFDKLSSPLYKEPGWGVQESYYERVRRDGADMHELMRGIIDGLVQNNRKILDKLDTYIGRARTSRFKEQEALFRTHARLYETRWIGMQKAAISGELQPVAEPTFPPDFPGSLDGEIQTVEKLIAGRPNP